MVGILVSFWDGPFWGAMLVSGRVGVTNYFQVLGWCSKYVQWVLLKWPMMKVQESGVESLLACWWHCHVCLNRLSWVCLGIFRDPWGWLGILRDSWAWTCFVGDFLRIGIPWDSPWNTTIWENVFGTFSKHQKSKSTPLKINMEHNHGGLEDHFPF